MWLVSGDRMQGRRADGPGPAGHRPWSVLPTYLFTALFLVVYAAWHLFPSIPLAHSTFAAVAQSPLGLVAAYLAWRASRRVRGSDRVRRAWILIALALLAQEAGSLFELAAE